MALAFHFSRNHLAEGLSYRLKHFLPLCLFYSPLEIASRFVPTVGVSPFIDQCESGLRRGYRYPNLSALPPKPHTWKEPTPNQAPLWLSTASHPPSSLFPRSSSSFFWASLIQWWCAFHSQLINRIFVKPPDPFNADRRDSPFSSKLADSDFVELEILGEFLSGHDLRHLVWPPDTGDCGVL